MGDPERWVLEGEGRGCLGEGDPSKKSLGKGAVPRDGCWEKRIREGGGGVIMEINAVAWLNSHDKPYKTSESLPSVLEGQQGGL